MGEGERECDHSISEASLRVPSSFCTGPSIVVGNEINFSFRWRPFMVSVVKHNLMNLSLKGYALCLKSVMHNALLNF